MSKLDNQIEKLIEVYTGGFNYMKDRYTIFSALSDRVSSCKLRGKSKGSEFTTKCIVSEINKAISEMNSKKKFICSQATHKDSCNAWYDRGISALEQSRDKIKKK